MNLKTQLRRTYDELTVAICELIESGDRRHVTKLALARTEIRETLICLEREEARPNVYRFPKSSCG